MTTPLGTSPSLAQPRVARPPVSPAGAASGPSADAPAYTRWSSPPQSRPTAEHLALVQALIRAGQLTRALELLDAVWHHDLHDERAWYFRLWVLSAQGRVLEALELVRGAAVQLPGSAALACLQASLEHAVGDPEVALEAALRASAVAPGRAESESVLELLLAQRAAPAGATDSGPGRLTPVDTPLNPVAMAIAAVTLLHPSGSLQPLRPTLPALEPPVPRPARDPHVRRRLWLIALATVVAAVWAVRDPLLASAALAGAVAWFSRRGRPVPR